MPMLIAYLTAEIRHRWRQVRETKDGGYTTESVLVTALLVTAAIVIIGVLASKVLAKANSLNLG